jgi:hypothetical protein
LLTAGEPWEAWATAVTDDDRAFVGFPHPAGWPALPDAVEIRLVDQAGNEQVTEIWFDFEVLAPPLYRPAAEVCPVNWDASAFMLGESGLSDLGRPFSPNPPPGVEVHGGLRMASHVLMNVHDFDVDVSIHPGELLGERTFRRAFLEAAPLSSDCAVGMCRSSWTSSDECQPIAWLAPKTKTEEWWVQTVIHVSRDGIAVLPDTKGLYRVAAGDSVQIDVVAPVSNTCWVGAAVEFETADGTEWLNFPAPSCELATQTWALTVCSEPSGSVAYSAPVAITEVRLGGAGPQGVFPLGLEYYPAGYYDHPVGEVVADPINYASTLPGSLPSLPE